MMLEMTKQDLNAGAVTYDPWLTGPFEITLPRNMLPIHRAIGA